MTILDPGTLTVGDTIYFKYTYQGHSSGGNLYLNKNNSNNSSHFKRVFSSFYYATFRNLQDFLI